MPTINTWWGLSIGEFASFKIVCEVYDIYEGIDGTVYPIISYPVEDETRLVRNEEGCRWGNIMFGGQRVER